MLLAWKRFFIKDETPEDAPGFLKKEGVDVLDTQKSMKDLKEATALAAKSFAGTEKTDPEWSIHWIIGPKRANFSHPDRIPFCRFILGNLICRQALILVAKGESGDLEAMVAARYLKGPTPKWRDTMEEWVGHLTVLIGGLGPFATCLLTDWKLNRRLFGAVDALHEKHHTAVPGPHLYVGPVAVDPDCQGRGHTGRLMRTLGKYADSKGIPCYLEATGVRNKSIYERFGYRVVESFHPSSFVKQDEEGNVQTEAYAMVRDPQKI
uniref:N-acetyltransferase domain-containing protein n=1 Tax=Chromera velia CCMP2878 TaxID=1169474 RepID=A0A0G4GHU7_9ALVE|mmetsp:Transcript_36679/g.72153  ORF Transcript_36679/g.72153 Transcript_36679/m.72153 type:complete len:265 (+) Transcript_36679:289-1083(+)|eukprot:Cvel_652.t1-p1 / transcript=Cvel_652.t1 / gene=Cvel_652 / organism=Chromera_velia_CCMP2878 / gene_product=hypothetical protein / transcript_product=hypothetical protein / location=Cvel_scaffold20:42839-44782(-) / protein_length=264 / sequence_SO=supercontig / SO=protein_coding / is_pseudo=false